MAEKYTHEQLVGQLDKPGWRIEAGKESEAPEGTLGAMVEAAHARHVKGESPGFLRELLTEIEVDMVQLQELWHHLGLPV